MNLKEFAQTYMNKLANIRKQHHFSSRPDDEAAYIVLFQAIEALREENYAIGACLVNNDTNQIILAGRNQVFNPFFRSDRHAEMDVLNKMEEIIQGPRTDLSSITLVTSLEPCPMCFARCISSGIGTVKYLAPDELGGMVHLKNQLPEVWKSILKNQNQKFEQADCLPELRDIALNIFLDTREALDEKLSKISLKPFKIPSSNQSPRLAITNRSR